MHHYTQMTPLMTQSQSKRIMYAQIVSTILVIIAGAIQAFVVYALASTHLNMDSLNEDCPYCILLVLIPYLVSGLSCAYNFSCRSRRYSIIVHSSFDV